MKRFAALSAALLALGGCSTLGGVQSSSLPVPGGVDSGANKDAIMTAMQGGLIGGTIGADLSKAEKRHALEAEYQALESTPSGQKVLWTGKDAGRRGEVVAAQPYRVGSQNCRQYSQTVFTEQGSQTARGGACRNGDGSWAPLT